MDKLAFVFSGQGSQKPGMGKALFDSIPAAKDIFDRHENIRPGTKAQCFEGDIQTLTQTANAQPCLYTLSLAVAKALTQQDVVPGMAAGFSMGEISALAYAGVFEGDDGFHFICERASVMQEQSLVHPGSMAAVLKLANRQVETMCREIGNLYPVNYNSPGQLVVAGQTAALAQLSQTAKALGGRVLPLKVSGAFHSPLMNEASELLKIIISRFHLYPARIPVYANLTAEPYPEHPDNFITRQINQPVLWQETIENMIKNGATDFIEIGAGNTLSGLIGKINSQAHTMHIEDKESFDEAVRRYSRRPANA